MDPKYFENHRSTQALYYDFLSKIIQYENGNLIEMEKELCKEASLDKIFKKLNGNWFIYNIMECYDTPVLKIKYKFCANKMYPNICFFIVYLDPEFNEYERWWKPSIVLPSYFDNFYRSNLKISLDDLMSDPNYVEKNIESLLEDELGPLRPFHFKFRLSQDEVSYVGIDSILKYYRSDDVFNLFISSPSNPSGKITLLMPGDISEPVRWIFSSITGRSSRNGLPLLRITYPYKMLSI